jgi:hypothetical protein
MSSGNWTFEIRGKFYDREGRNRFAAESVVELLSCDGRQSTFDLIDYVDFITDGNARESVVRLVLRDLRRRELILFDGYTWRIER